MRISDGICVQKLPQQIACSVHENASFPQFSSLKKSLHRILTLYRDFLLAFALRLLLDAGGHNIILPELIRRHADVFGKLQIEIALRVISHHLRDTRDGQVGRDQQRLCFTDAAAQQILHGQ